MHPTRRSTFALVVVAVVLVALSPVGQNGASGPSWVGDLGWYGFMVCALLLIASGLSATASRIRDRRRLSPQ